MLIAFPSWGRLNILFDTYVIGWTVWLAVVSAVGFAIWNHISTLYPVPLLASCRFIIPISGMVQSLVFLDGETMTFGLLIGAALVLGSILSAVWLSPDRKRN